MELPDVSKLEGTLGDICRERALDYTDASLELTPRENIRRFENALIGSKLKLIAEVKRASPRGDLNTGLSALEAAQAYADGGASAISVLTEPRRFLGSFEDLALVSSQVALPTLCKDFVLHPAMLTQAVQAQASAVLLLVNAIAPPCQSCVIKAVGVRLSAKKITPWGIGLLCSLHKIRETRD